MSNASPKRIYLSAPHMGGTELGYVQEAFETNWLSTVGPNIDAFERELGEIVGGHVCALASGTAAIHLGLRLTDVGPGDEVLTSTLTFVASANPILYQGAKPVFLDSERASWNMDPDLLAEHLAERVRRGRALPKALVLVHLFGQSADVDRIAAICAEYEVPLIEDAAEALGTHYRGRQVGLDGLVGVFSFNGNKILTSTGGGALVSKDPELVKKVRFWSTQARDPGVAYEHSEVGYNYRMSNVIAGIGRGQLEVLEQRVAERRAVAFRYQQAFADLPGIALMPQAEWGRHTNWLSVFLIDENAFGASRNQIIEALAAENIESRPVWKPMHLQQLFAGAEVVGGRVAEDLFARGICLPSSSSISAEEQSRVIEVVRRVGGGS